MSKTTIVILNWNGIRYLKLFLETIVRYSAGPDTHICVADNCSTDGSAEWIADNFKDIKLIRFDKNHGFAEGYNMALSQLESEYFILLNSDIEVTENWIQPLVSFMDSNPDAASCQPKILSYHNKDRFEYAGAAGGFIDKFGYPFCRGRIFDKTETDSGQYDTQTDIFWSSGACMIVRSEAWNRFGGFDPDFFAHMEEIDLCWRFSKAGYRVSYVPNSVVYHVGGGTLPYDSPFKTYLNFRNNLFLLFKNLPDNKLRSVLLVRKILDGMAAVLFIVKGNFRSAGSVWKAHMDYYKSMSRLRKKRDVLKKMDTTPYSPLIFNKSIVIEFYVKGHKTFKSLKT
ncbi:MAG TPA: glycosyltransferase family 2 protein [Bacteroidales bacterium]|nr:glycosyltransferase family 2 protein [Bacteroidales bacterium]